MSGEPEMCVGMCHLIDGSPRQVTDTRRGFPQQPGRAGRGACPGNAWAAAEGAGE
jgi:hypothetical protein